MIPMKSPILPTNQWKFIIWPIFRNIFSNWGGIWKNSRFCLHLMVKFEENDTQEILELI